MENAKCSSCGAEVSGQALECPQCGASVGEKIQAIDTADNQFEKYSKAASQYLNLASEYLKKFFTTWKLRREEKKVMNAQASMNKEQTIGKYLLDTLVEGEDLVYKAKIHWIYLFFSLIYYYFSEMVITNKRFIVKTGWISRNTTEMSFNKIESVNVNQGIFGRILGYGTVTLIGTGGTKEKYRGIVKPADFRKKILEMQKSIV
jgi:hypothetical protein